MKVLILAGGSGDRLFPLSRENIPKQFIKINEFGDTSLFQKTILRSIKITNDIHDIYISTNLEYENIINRQLLEISIDIPQKNIIRERNKKNTLYAITHGLKYIDKSKMNDKKINRDLLKEPVIIMPSDHIVSDSIVNNILYESKNYTTGTIILFGIATKEINNSGYGYIITTDEDKIDPINNISEKAKDYKRYIPEIFLEKPDKKTLKMHKDINNNIFINSGIFILSPHTFFNLLKIYDGDFYSKYFDSNIQLNDIPNISFDKGFLELLPTNILRLNEIECEWIDVGDFSRLHSYLKLHEILNFEKDNKERNIISIQSNNNLVKNNRNKKICLVGVENFVVIDTNDITLICNLNKTDLMKDLITTIKNTNPEIFKQVDLEYRNWGYYEVLINEKIGNYKIKRIYIDVNKQISLQKHLHRKEIWTIVHGVARITLNNDKMEILEQGTTLTIDIGDIHKIENIGKIPLEIIEVQLGEYLGEDDIIRFT